MQNIMRIFPPHIKNLLESLNLSTQNMQEIRVRINSPIYIMYQRREINTGHVVKESDIAYIMERICHYSLYAYEEEMRQGFVTIEGGHRIGLAGKVILQNSKIKSMSNITCLNIRVAGEKTGCADDIIGQLIEEGRVCHTLIMSPPGGGKTTILRDIIRQISDGCVKKQIDFKGINVGIVDERSEIAACYKGIPSNDVGARTDILDACPKAEGIIRLVRTMAPKVIAVDEIGGKNDYEAIEYALTSGCSILATIHGKEIDDLKKNIYFKNCLEQGLFERLVIPKGAYGACNRVFKL